MYLKIIREAPWNVYAYKDTESQTQTNPITSYSSQKISEVYVTWQKFESRI